MVFCNKCGKENQDFTKFCTGCGNNILTAAQPVLMKEEEITPVLKEATVNELLCPQCGNPNKPNAKFCISCGNKLSAFPQLNMGNENIPVPETTKTENCCNKCGKQNKEAVKFCIVCGNNLMLPKEGFSINDQNDNSNASSAGEVHTIFSEEIKSATESSTDNNVTNFENKVARDDHQPALKTVQQTNPGTNEEVWLQDESNTIPGDPSTENYSTPNKKKRKKVIFLTIGILVLAGLGFLLLFGNMTNLFSEKKIANNQQDTLPKIEPQATEVNRTSVKDSIIPKVNVIDSVPIPLPGKNAIVKPTDIVIKTPSEKNTNRIVPIETPIPPTLQMAINDLTGQGISQDLVFTKNAKVLSYDIAKKTIQQCNVTITFKLQNSDVKYTATLIYKNIDGSYIYENNTSSFKTLPAKQKEQSPPLSSTDHNVKGDLINYLRQKKIFNGIKYNDVTEIVIINIHDKEYYAEYGNTSYQVDLTINNISSKCQVNYTIDGKFYVNPLR